MRLLKDELFGDTCYHALTFEGKTRVKTWQVTMYLSPDGRFLTSELFDTTIDPVEAERKKSEALLAGLAQNRGASKGADTAPVTIVEFSDFECPYCKKFTDILAEVWPEEKDQARVVFHHMPLSIHTWARVAAEGAACAQLQNADAFWSMHDQIFQHQQQITVDNIKQKLSEYAKSTKSLDIKSFQACLDNEMSLGLVFRDMNLASANNIDATPTIYINGHHVPGVRGAQQLRDFIAEAKRRQRKLVFLISRTATAKRTTLGCRRMRRFALFGGSALIAGFALSQESSHGDVWRRMLQDAYAEHLARVRAALPPHSGTPPLLDLSQSKQTDGGKDRAWEERFKGLGFSTGIHDPGVPGPSEATSIATTFVEAIGRPSALPARSCGAVVIATPIAAVSRIAYTQTLVYSRYSLAITKVLKGNQKHGFREGAEVFAVQLGGRLLFPSGHMTTFIFPDNGFLDVGKQYCLFIWMPPKTKTYMIANSYLVQDGTVFPLNIEPDVSAYEKGMPTQQFEATVKAAIAKNIDTN